METNLPLCILLPAKTPLFAHVYLAVSQATQINQYPVTLQEVPDDVYDSLPNQNAALDKYVLKCVRDNKFPLEHPRYSVLAGICDPHFASDYHKTETVAAVVKRLGLFVVGHPDLDLTFDNLRSAGISEIRAHGHSAFEVEATIANERAFRSAGSSAQVTALAIRGALEIEETVPVRSYLFGAVSGGASLDEKNDRLWEATFANGSINRDTLYITADILTLARLVTSKQASARAVSELVPEWSRTLLSSVIVRTATREDSVRRECLETFLRELNIASFLMHIDTGGLLQNVLSTFFDVKDIAVADQMAAMLRENRLVPENVVSSRLGRYCSQSLWSGTLAKFRLVLPNKQKADAAHSGTLNFEREIYQSAMRTAAGPPRCLDDITSPLEVKRLGKWIQEEYPSYETFVREKGQDENWIARMSCGKVKRVDGKSVPKHERHLDLPLELLLRSRFRRVDASVAYKGPAGRRRQDVFIVDSVWVELKHLPCMQDTRGFLVGTYAESANDMVEEGKTLGIFIVFVDPGALPEEDDLKWLSSTVFEHVQILLPVRVDLEPDETVAAPNVSNGRSGDG